MAIPFAQQYFVEKDRNYKYLFLSVLVSVFLPVLHGVLFLWLPRILRGKRSPETLNHRWYFTFLKYWNSFTKTFRVSILGRHFYFQPSLLIMAAFHIGINAVFCILQTHDINYEPWSYIVSKRVGRISIAHVPIILLFVAKNNLVSAASGLTGDKAVFFHKWYGRSMFLSAIIHMVLSLQYWLGLKFYIMIKIPPQIFGFIAISCLGMLNLASLKFIRNFAFEFFLFQHRVFNFVMLLLAYFHNGGNHAAVILGVHLLVVDRIAGRVYGIIHKYKGPTKGLCDFEILDETTVRVSIPIKVNHNHKEKWYWYFIPRYATWRAGQHILFNCNRVALLAYHPFTIASLADSGKMVLVIKVHKGFTKQLMKKLEKMGDAQDAESVVSVADLIHSTESSESVHSNTQLKKNDYTEEIELLSRSVQTFKKMVDSFTAPSIFNIKAGINGPFGANYQTLTKFDHVMFFSAGSGASFTLPVALDLLKTLKERDEAEDFLYRPAKTQVTIVMSMKKYANLQWYDHLWKEFMPFFNSGRAHFALHITQEIPDASDFEKEPVPEKLDGFGESTLHSSSTFDAASELEATGFTLTHGRPDFDKLIGTSIQELCSLEYRHAFACLGCGPGAFNQEMKRVCQKGRWFTDAPDVYCYDESFD